MGKTPNFIQCCNFLLPAPGGVGGVLTGVPFPPPLQPFPPLLPFPPLPPFPPLLVPFSVLLWPHPSANTVNRNLTDYEHE